MNYLPPFAPELNPDEYLNCDLKEEVARRATARDGQEIEQKAARRLRSLQRPPEQFKKVLQHPRVRYAA